MKNFNTAILPFAVFLIIGFAVYSNVLDGEFISDDYITVAENTSIRSLAGIKEMWRAFNTRFLVGYTFALNYRVCGLDVIGYHIVNILIHILVVSAVYALILLIFQTPEMKGSALKRCAQPVALFASLIFLCHPLQTQAVAYITQRAASLATLFYISTLLCYVLYRLKGKGLYYAGALLCMLAGAFTKEMTVTIPVMILAVEFFFFSPSWAKLREKIKTVLPFFALLVLYPLVFMQDKFGSILNLKSQMHSREFSIQFFLTEINVLITYLRLMVFPVNQMHDYDYPLVKSFMEPRLWLSIAALAGLLLIAVRIFRKERIFSFCIAWFFIATSVEAGVVCFVNRGVIYEHWIYLAMAGFSLFAAGVAFRFFPERKAKTVLVPVLILLAAAAYQRNFVWQNEIRLWEDNVRKSPKKPYLGLCIAYQNKGFDEKALACYQSFLARIQSMSVRQRHQISGYVLSRVYNNIGLIYFLHNRDKEALESYKTALKHYPKNGRVYNNLGMFYYYTGEYEKSVEHYQKSVSLQGEYPYAFYYTGLSYKKMGDKASALEILRMAEKSALQQKDTEMLNKVQKALAGLSRK